MTPENYHDFLTWLQVIQWQENERGALDEGNEAFSRVREMALGQFASSASDAAQAIKNMEGKE